MYHNSLLSFSPFPPFFMRKHECKLIWFLSTGTVMCTLPVWVCFFDNRISPTCPLYLRKVNITIQRNRKASRNNAYRRLSLAGDMPSSKWLASLRDRRQCYDHIISALRLSRNWTISRASGAKRLPPTIVLHYRRRYEMHFVESSIFVLITDY